ncbi:MAG: hypothetical protein ACLFTR_05450, partial [Candidatus Woesearchaeota archaeon]
ASIHLLTFKMRKMYFMCIFAQAFWRKVGTSLLISQILSSVPYEMFFWLIEECLHTRDFYRKIYCTPYDEYKAS